MFGIPIATTLSAFLLACAARQVVLSPPQVPDTACRCLHGDPCWPSQEAFAALAARLSRPLVRPLPTAHPCYAAPDGSDCLEARGNWKNGTWRADRPGAAQHPNFEAFVSTATGEARGCYFNTTLGLPCDQGSVPVIGVDARTVEDIQLAVEFAARHNLRLVVKNTGHDFLGRSSGRGSFLLWTHHMKGTAFHEVFKPVGATPGEVYEHAVTVKAGVQWQEAYEAADAAGRMIVGGVSPGGSVGAAGGWLLGGGHSALSPSYGLGVDNVLEISLVIASGEHLTVNAHQHSDLFWALRGGGGGTFGVVTAMTYRTHPIVPVVAALLSASASASGPRPPSAVAQAYTELIRTSSRLTDAGWGGYAGLLPPLLSGDAKFRFYLLALVPNITWAAANATIGPYLDHVRALAEGSKGELTLERAFTAPFPSFWAMYGSLMPRTGQVGHNLEIASWLLPRRVLDEDPERVASTIMGISGVTYELVAGGAVSKVDPGATGLLPAWRKAGAHVAFGAMWPDAASVEDIARHRRRVELDMGKVRALAPESGAYFNEASMFEPDPQHTFFGDHYPRLRDIKMVYDPNDLFIVIEGVGSEDWDEALQCRKWPKGRSVRYV